MITNQSFNSDPDLITLNATVVTAASINIPDGNTASVILGVLARGLTDGASAMWEVRGQVKNIGGVLTAVPAGIINVFAARKDVAAAAWDATFTISGTDILVRVTGSATQSVGWSFIFNVVGFSNFNVGGII